MSDAIVRVDEIRKRYPKPAPRNGAPAWARFIPVRRRMTLIKMLRTPRRPDGSLARVSLTAEPR